MTSTTAQKLIKNARIFTSAEGDSELHEALVVEGNKVKFVGTLAEAEKHVQVRIRWDVGSEISVAWRRSRDRLDSARLGSTDSRTPK
jgi:hypothetical protein